MQILVSIEEEKQVSKKNEDNKYSAAGIINPEYFEKYFHTVQGLVVNGKREDVAIQFCYPVTIKIQGKDVAINNKQELLNSYEKIFTIEVVKAVKMQKVENLFVNAKGVMIGNGQLWFGVGEKGDSYYILGVNP